MLKTKQLEEYVKTNKVFFIKDVKAMGYKAPKRALYCAVLKFKIHTQRVTSNSFKRVTTSRDLHREFFKRKEKDNFLTRYMKRQLVV